MDKITAQGSHSQLSLQGMIDNIWRHVASDIVGQENSRLRYMIPLITSFGSSRASLTVGEFYSRMIDYGCQSRPTIKTQLDRAIDLGYVHLQTDARDKRVKRIHATDKAIRAVDLADQLTLLGCQQLVRTQGGDIDRIGEKTMEVFETDVAFDAASIINNQRGRQKA